MHLLIHPRPSCGGQWIDPRRIVVIEIQLLTVSDSDVLLGSCGNRENSQFERAIVYLFEQTRIPFHRLVAVVNLASPLLLHDLSDHFPAIDDHAEVADAGPRRNGKRVERLHNALLCITKDLPNFCHRDSVIDDDRNFVTVNLKYTPIASVGDQ